MTAALRIERGGTAVFLISYRTYILSFSYHYFIKFYGSGYFDKIMI